jgi:hypothetical protein
MVTVQREGGWSDHGTLVVGIHTTSRVSVLTMGESTTTKIMQHHSIKKNKGSTPQHAKHFV